MGIAWDLKSSQIAMQLLVPKEKCLYSIKTLNTDILQKAVKRIKY